MTSKEIVNKTLIDNQLKIDNELLVKIADKAMKIGAIQFANWMLIEENYLKIMSTSNPDPNKINEVNMWAKTVNYDNRKFTSEELYEEYLKSI